MPNPPLNFKIVTEEGPDGAKANLTLYLPGEAEPEHADSTNPNWKEILKRVRAGDLNVVELINPHKALGRVLLSDRLTYDSGRLYFDGDVLNDGLAKLIADMVVKGEDCEPFVHLLDKIHQNPSQNSRRQLYNYIDRNHVTITTKGDMVLYKTVKRQQPGNAGVRSCSYESIVAGPAIVNGQPHNSGPVPQTLGDVVTMARSQVVDNPAAACSTGLHVGAWKYNGVSGDCKLEVHVNPRDVVSVPTDHSERKIRVCRYTVIREVSKPYEERVLPPETLVRPVSAPEAASKDSRIKVKHPTGRDFKAARVTARLQRKGLNNYATNRLKWILRSGATGEHRTDWVIPSDG